MNLLDRYIARVVLLGTAIALLILVSLDAFFAFVGEAGDIGEGSYGVLAVFRFILYTLPHRAYTLFPFAAMMGGLFGLGMLASNHELVAIRVAGISIGRILLSVLMVGVMMQLVVAAIGEFVAPAGQQRAQLERELAKFQRVTFHKSAYGFWARDGNYFVNIRGILPGGRLKEIRVYELDDKMQIKKTTQAQYAGFSGEQWMLLDVRQSVVNSNGVETVAYEKLAWDTLLSPELLRVLAVDPRYLSSRDLYRYIRYLDDNALDSDQYRLVYWSNIAAPFSGLVMLFLSVPFVFGPLRSVGAGQRLMVGLLVGLTFYLVNQTISQLGQVYGVNPVLSVFAPLVLFVIGGMVAMRWVR